MDILTYLQGQGRHSIDVLLAIYSLTQERQREPNEIVSLSWKEIGKWIEQNMSKISDSTYRARRQELLEMGLVELERINPLASNVKLTPKGMTIASLIKQFADTIRKAEQNTNTE